MKVCRECNIEKPLFDFYTHARMKDGHLNKCKVCVKSRVHKYTEVNSEKRKQWVRNYISSEKGKEKSAQYFSTEHGKAVKKRSSENYRKRYPLKIKANHLVAYALECGNLMKPSVCSECKSESKLEGHHDDYTKPLVIRWLCISCHKSWHRKNKPIYE